jgi:O-antigen/teichoic acid export membrane protein
MHTAGVAPNIKVHKKRPSLMLSAISSWVVLVINAALALVITPYIISKIGKSGYGVWALVSGLVGYYSFLRLGVGSAIMRYVSLYDGKGDRAAVNANFSAAIVIYLVVGTFISLIALTFSNSLSSFFGQGKQFATLVVLTGISAGLACPCAVLEATMRAREKFALANTLMLSLTIARSLGLFGCLYLGFGLIGMGIVTMTLSGLDWAIMAIIFRHACSDIRFELQTIKLSHFKSLLSFGFMSSFVALGLSLRYDSDRIVIGKIMSMEMLGIYAVVSTIIANYRNIIRATTRALNPRFSFLDGTGDHNESISLFFRSSKMSNLLGSGLGVLIILLGPEFVRLWVGPGFEKAYLSLTILGAANIIGQSQSAATAYFNGIGRQAVMAVVTLSEGFLSIILSLVLGLKFGLTGVAAGITISMVLVQAIAFPIYICHFLKVNLWNYFRHCMLGPWAITAVLVIVAEILVHHGNVHTWPHLIISAMLFSVIFSSAAYLLVLTPPERINLVRSALQLLPKPLLPARRPSSNS